MTLTREQITLAIRAARTIQRAYPGGGLTPNIVSEQTDTQGHIALADDGIWDLTFPGTASRRDMLTDLIIIKQKWINGYIHWGVRRAVDSILDQVLAQMPFGAKVRISGHSLGSGIAQAVADRLAYFAYAQVVGVFTFGGLRVFNLKAAREYNQRLGAVTLRFTNHGDPVPHLPFQLPILRTGIYWQTAGEIHINKTGQLEAGHPWYATVLPALCKAAAKLQRADTNQKLVSEFIRLSAHPIADYIKRLEKLTNTL